MGIDIHGLYCLLHARKFGPFGETVTLGRQKISVSPARVRSLLRDDPPASTEPMLERHFGATKVDSIDYSDYEGATLTHDMNLPVPPDLGTFDTVIDFGTIEHVFDIAVALANIRALCRVGGQILHVSPADNFCGHGFWQLSPELFFSLYSASNGFTDTEIFLARRSQAKAWYRVSPPRPGRRIPLYTSGKTFVICRTVRTRLVAHPQIQQSDYLSEWTGSARKETWFYRKIQYKYFRRLSSLNPHLTKIPIAKSLTP